MLLIPAIDIYENKTIRLLKGNFSTVKYYAASPLEQARYFESIGYKTIHLVDLKGSRDGAVTVIEILNNIKKETSLQIQFGGGIRNKETVKLLIESGVNKIIIGSLAIKNKCEFESILGIYNPEIFIVAADVKENKIAVEGWSEQSTVSLNNHIKYCKSAGVNKFICTDISKDGTLSGPNTDFYKNLMEEFPETKFIASGGIKDAEDIRKLQKMNLYAAVAGKAIYENKISETELRSFAE